MKNRKMFRLTALLLSIILLTACTGQGEPEEYHIEEDNKLIVYTSHKEEIYEPIIREFEERTGIWVEVVPGGTNEMLERIAQENGKNSGDIMFGGGVDSLEAYQEYFAPYHSSQSESLDDAYASEDDSYTVFSRLPIVIVYNNKLVFQAGKPRSFKELLDTRWKGKIAFADPDRSGSCYTALLSMIQILSEDMPKEEVMQRFAGNLEGHVLSGSGAILEEVVEGTRPVGIVLEEAALKEQAKGADIGMIYPIEGTTAVPDGCAIIKNAPHPENAELFMEFTVSEDVQKLLEERLYRRSVRKGRDAEDIKEIIYDLEYSEKYRDEILEDWKELTGQEGA